MKDKEFNRFKLEGILEYNKAQASTENPTYQRVRKRKLDKGNNNITHCSNMFISEKSFHRQIRTCRKTPETLYHKSISTSIDIIEMTAKYSHMHFSDDIKKYIIEKLRKDRVGNLCRQDKTILRSGSIFSGKIRRKRDKKVQVRKTVRSKMRMLGHMYLLLIGQQDFTSTYKSFCRSARS